jgi:hypothetical protein
MGWRGPLPEPPPRLEGIPYAPEKAEAEAEPAGGGCDVPPRDGDEVVLGWIGHRFGGPTYAIGDFGCGDPGCGGTTHQQPRTTFSSQLQTQARPSV